MPAATWIAHVKSVYSKGNMTYKEAMKRAAKTWKKKKSGAAAPARKSRGKRKSKAKEPEDEPDEEPEDEKEKEAPKRKRKRGQVREEPELSPNDRATTPSIPPHWEMCWDQSP